MDLSKTKIIRITACAALFSCAAVFCFPRAALGASGTSAAEFLKIPPGARAAALAGAYAAVADDKTALYYNPAGLSQLQNDEIGLSYNKWILDTSLSTLVYAHTFGRYGSAAVGVTYYDSGSIDKRESDRDLAGNFKNTALSASVGYGNEFFEGGSFGAALKYVSETVAEEGSAAFACDIGAHYKTIFDFGETSFGVSVGNIGSKLWENYNLPMLLRAGVCVKPVKNTLAVSADIANPPEGLPTAGLGVEITPSQTLSLRGGYRIGASDVSGLSAMTFGIGYKYTMDYDYIFNYAFSTQGDLGVLHRAEIGFGF